MDFLIIGSVAFMASGLTLYSGFDWARYCCRRSRCSSPAPTAVAATGAVHLLNNVFKGGLVGSQAHWPTVLRFGLPAVPGAIAGAYVLAMLSGAPAFQWQAFGREFALSAASIIIGMAMIVFAVLELMPRFQRLAAPPRLIPIGGLITGFVGGLTGQQGALRSMFLFKSVETVVRLHLGNLLTWFRPVDACDAAPGEPVVPPQDHRFWQRRTFHLLAGPRCRPVAESHDCLESFS